jgi:cysteinyl-tRNA synthetase
VTMIERLVDQGHAYAAAGHVLFAVDSHAAYGRLSGRTVEDMIAGARVEVAPYKRNPMDFVLWKPSTPDLPGWDSPWGRGRPGWHIECSAMARELLGDTFDIHGGGIDLQFPHHENEIAQSKCAHPEGQFARYWLHNEMLLVEGKKMSKSLGNFFTVRDLLDQGVPGEVIRFVLLSTHYRSPMDWTEKKRAEAETVLRKWRGLVADIEPAPNSAPAVLEALADDLNTAGAIAVLHLLAGKGDAAGLKASAALMGLLTDELADWAWAPHTHNRSANVTVTSRVRARGTEIRAETTALIERLLAERTRARQLRDFARADQLRDAFAAAGVVVRDTPEGAEWEVLADFDPEKLECVA